MQAMPISTLPPENAPSPAPATLLPFDPPSSSPFTAVFQAILKNPGNSGKFPVAGRPQDSSREPARTTGTANNLFGLFPQELIAPTFAPNLPESSHNVFAPSVVPDIPLARGQASLSDPLPLVVTAGLAINSTETNATPLATPALTVTPPSTESTTNFVNGQTTLPNPLPLEATVDQPLNSFQISGAPPATATLKITAPTTASTGNHGKGAAALPNPLPIEALGGLVTNSLQTNVTPPATAALKVTAPTTATTGQVANSSQTNITPPATAALTANAATTPSTSNPANTVHASRVPQDLIAATKIAANGPDPQPNSDSSTGVSQPADSSQNTAPGAAAGQMVTSDSDGPANPTNVFMTAAVEQTIPIAPLTNSNFVQQELGPPPMQVEISDTQAGSQPLPLGKLDISSSVIQNVSKSGPNPPNSQIVQTARPNQSFLSMGTLISAATTTKASVTGSPQPVPNQSAQSNLQPLVSPSPAPAETLAHAVAKSAAIGASTFRFHENLLSPGTNPGFPAPVAATTAKTQSQDSSNGSPGNDSNAKPDGTSKVAGARTDEKTFVQSLNTAGANPNNGHSAATDSTAGAAGPPVQAPIASSGAPPAAPGSAEPRPAESLPAAAQNAPVVSAAHILNQSGQTEIRIEMQADSLGGVELRAHIAGDQIGASIAVEHHDVQVALATDLPALHSALAEKNLRVETLTVSHGNFSSLSGGPGQDTGQRGFAQSAPKFAYAERPEQVQVFMEAPAEWAASSHLSAGLSVVA
jgi:flagellar hook-length control protein FliK